MKIIRPAFVLGGFLFCLLLWQLDTACAQVITPRTYLFVEVKDATGQVVADTTVKVSNADGKQAFTFETNKEGVVNTQFLQENCHHYDVRISKSGYLPYEQVFFANQTANLMDGMPDRAEDFQNPHPQPSQIVLLKTPVAPGERRALAVEERKRQLLLAAKRGDTASLNRLLQAGVKVDSVDARGVPAIAWAAFAGDPETIKVLLAARADVRNKNTLAHQALLIYLAEGISRWRHATGSNDGRVASEKEWVDLHEEIVRQLIEEGAGINVQDPYRGTVLNRAIIQVPHSLSLGTIKALITAGANVNAVDERGQTPLMLAARSNAGELIRVLLAAGAKASLNGTVKGGSALVNAAQGYQDSTLEIVNVLIAAGANANEVNEDGQTTLMMAAKGASLNTIQTLLKAGAVASINAKDKRGQTALVYAVTGYGVSSRDSATELVVKALLAAGANINDLDAEGRSALMYATLTYHESILGLVKTLIGAGANVNEVEVSGQTPLMVAVKTGSIQIVQTLLQAGARASVNAKDKQGVTALLYVVPQPHDHATEIAQALLTAGANVNEVNADGQTSLMIAMQRDFLETVKVLLAAGAATNAKDKQGRTALMYARPGYRGTDRELVTALISAGAKVNETDAAGLTPLMVATQNAQQGNVTIVQTLLEAGADVNAKDTEGQTALMYAATGYEDSRLKVVKLLIAARADVNAVNAGGQSALMRVAGYYQSGEDIVRTLITAGANVNAVDNNGETVLMSAARADSVETIKTLLQAGVPINAQDNQGQTALMYAIAGTEYMRVEKVKQLLAAGCDASIKNNQGKTALRIARDAGYEIILKLLEDLSKPI